MIVRKNGRVGRYMAADILSACGFEDTLTLNPGSRKFSGIPVDKESLRQPLLGILSRWLSLSIQVTPKL